MSLDEDRASCWVRLVGWSVGVAVLVWHARTNGTPQSLHHCCVGYHPCHTNDLAKKAYPCKCKREHKQEQRSCNQNCIDHEVGSHKPMNGDTVRGQNKSKQNPNPKVAAATE